MWEEESYLACLNSFQETRRDLLDVYRALTHRDNYPLEMIAGIERRLDLLEGIIPRLMALQQLGPMPEFYPDGDQVSIIEVKS